MTPRAELDPRYSSSEATAVDWETARDVFAGSRLYWLVTVRSDGRPHTTPLVGLWDGEAAYFTTGPEEQKTRNLAANAHCSLIAGANHYDHGLEVVVEGVAERITDTTLLGELSAAYDTKYGGEWHFDVTDDGFTHHAGVAHVFEVAPVTAYGFGKDVASHTRWRFGSSD